MGDLGANIIAGMTVAIVSGIGGFVLKQVYFEGAFVLPKARRYVEKGSYSHLSGTWHLYWLSHGTSQGEIRWMHGIQELQVTKNKVLGSTEFIDHPFGSLHFTLRGEIRAGRMLITDQCLEDETEFAVVMYPNLRNARVLVGVWAGLDNRLSPTAAPVVLSRDEMSAGALNETVRTSTVSVIAGGEHGAYALAARAK